MNSAITRVVLLVLGVLLLASCGGSVPVSSAHPLGEFDTLASILEGKGLHREEADATRLGWLEAEERGLEDAEAWEFQDTTPGFRTAVWVVTDGSGKVCAVACRMRSGSAVFSTVGGRAESFIADYWLSVAGAEPAFQKKQMKGDHRDYLHATFKNGNLRGEWTKDSGDASGIKLPHQIADMVMFIRS